MSFNPSIHHRRSIRLKGYDYAGEGLYFITLCCQDMQHLFGEIMKREMNLNKAGEIVKEEWEKTPAIRQNIALHEYIIMPNHFHAIIEILFSRNFGENIGEFKSPSHSIRANCILPQQYSPKAQLPNTYTWKKRRSIPKQPRRQPELYIHWHS